MNEPVTPFPPAGVPPQGGFWSTIREAIRGSELDFTRVSVSRAVILLAVPMVLEMAMESLFIKIPLAYALAIRANMGPHGVFVAITVAYGTQTVIAAILFRRGRWKLKRI